MQERLAEELNIISISISHAYHYWSKKHGFKDYETIVFYELLTHDQMTLTEIVKRSNFPKQSISKGIHRLLEQGYLEQFVDKSDSRIKWCRLTSKGMAFAKEKVMPLVEIEDKITQKMGKDKAVLLNQLIGEWNEIFWTELKER